MFVLIFVNLYTRADGFIDEMQYNIITGSQKIVYTKWIRQFRYGSNGFRRFRPPRRVHSVYLLRIFTDVPVTPVTYGVFHEINHVLRVKYF